MRDRYELSATLSQPWLSLSESSCAVFWSLVAVGVSSAVIWGVYPGSIPVTVVIALGMRQGQQHGYIFCHPQDWRSLWR